MLDCFQYGILFRCHEMTAVSPLAVSVARELYLDGYYKVIAFGSASCKKCEKCNGEHCIKPNQAIPSLEACGIDVFATVRNNGLEIHTLREKEEQHNFFGLLMVE